jgi:hypothetical protein
LFVVPDGTVGGVEPAGGVVVLVPVPDVLDPVPEVAPVVSVLDPVDPVVPLVEPLMPLELLDPDIPVELLPVAPDPLLIPLESMFFWMLAGQVSAIMSTRSTTNSLLEA